MIVKVKSIFYSFRNESLDLHNYIQGPQRGIIIEGYYDGLSKRKFDFIDSMLCGGWKYSNLHLDKNWPVLEINTMRFSAFFTEYKSIFDYIRNKQTVCYIKHNIRTFLKKEKQKNLCSFIIYPKIGICDLEEKFTRFSHKEIEMILTEDALLYFRLVKTEDICDFQVLDEWEIDLPENNLYLKFIDSLRYDSKN